ncbi:MAG: DNA methyltransferase [Gammaproteobacteria bacterium]|nr:DNA methyltransferase [Gammaproteobacteria bacterium]
MNEPNFVNQTIWTGDNLPITRGMNSESIDLIYLDPPFNSNTNYAAPIGSQAAGAEFKDTWTLQDVDIAWLDLIEVKYPQLNKVIHAALNSSDKSYLIYIAVRLLEMHRLLKTTGSIYLHCDPTMSHWLKLLLDSIFEKRNFRNEIIWHYYNGTSNIKGGFCRKHDVILFYAKSLTDFKFNENDTREPYHPESNFVRNPKSYKDKYKPHPLGKRMHDVWRIPTINNMARERVGYPTQKPLSLLERIIKASSNKDDIVFDPFCGCATTLIAADSLQRQWVGIDISPTAVRLVRERLKDGSTEGEHKDQWRNVIARNDIPERTDIGVILPYNHKDNKRSLFALQEGVCNGCSEHYQFKDFHVDHIIDRKSGGTDHLNNLQLLCGHCNSVKGDRGMEYLIAKLAA